MTSMVQMQVATGDVVTTEDEATPMQLGADFALAAVVQVVGGDDDLSSAPSSPPPLPAGVDEAAADLAAGGQIFCPAFHPAGLQLANCPGALAADAKSYHVNLAG